MYILAFGSAQGEYHHAVAITAAGGDSRSRVQFQGKLGSLAKVPKKRNVIRTCRIPNAQSLRRKPHWGKKGLCH